MCHIQPHDEHSLLSAETEYGTAIRIYDDGWGPLWIYSTDPYGSIAMVVRAQTFEQAYECAIDESPTIDASEVHEAYGCESQAQLDALVEEEECPDLIEGYQHQSNSTGTGIVDVGHSENLCPLTAALVRALSITVKIGPLLP